VEHAFLGAIHFSWLQPNQARDCHEVKGGHSLQLAELRSNFLRQLKVCMMNGLLGVNHLVRLSLNQNQDWDKLRKSYSGGMV
jgi:hypothetical protein